MKTLKGVVAATLAALIILATYLLIREFLGLYQKADANFKLGVVTALGSGAAFIWTNIHESRRERQSRHFENKREAYNKFFGLLFDIFNSQRSPTPMTEREMIEKFSDFTRGVMVWGSADTINSINNFQRQNITPPSGPVETFRRMETLLKALRKDLGHGDSNLENFGLTKLMLKAEDHHTLN